MPPTLKIRPSTAMASDTQNTMFTQEVVQLRPSKVPDSNCVPRKIANAQLIIAQRNEVVVFSVIAVNLALIISILTNLFYNIFIL